MSCEEIRELFSDHLDGALSLEAEDRLGRHVEACPRCREELGRYEASIGALAGRGPEPPRELEELTVRRLVSDGLLSRPSVGLRPWLSLAAGVAVLAIGLAVGRFTASRDGETLGREAGVPATARADACSGGPVGLPLLDPRALRALPDTRGSDRVVAAGPYSLRLPRRFTSRGPYEPDPSASLERGGGTCLPLNTPFGTRLVLSLTPAVTESADGAGTFVVEIDPTRVLYARVLWLRDGFRWSLEGRAEAAELLDVAREIASRAEVVPRADADQPL